VAAHTSRRQARWAAKPVADDARRTATTTSWLDVRDRGAKKTTLWCGKAAEADLVTATVCGDPRIAFIEASTRYGLPFGQAARGLHQAGTGAVESDHWLTSGGVSTV